VDTAWLFFVMLGVTLATMVPDPVLFVLMFGVLWYEEVTVIKVSVKVGEMVKEKVVPEEPMPVEPMPEEPMPVVESWALGNSGALDMPGGTEIQIDRKITRITYSEVRTWEDRAALPFLCGIRIPFRLTVNSFLIVLTLLTRLPTAPERLISAPARFV
jgi:hypothetical protein